MASEQEQWETTTRSRIWINVTNRSGDMRPVKVGGRVGHKFRISVEDRLANQDDVMEPHLDVFTNGMLHRLSGDAPIHPPLNSGYGIEDLDAPAPDPVQMLSTEDLRGILGKHGNAFRTAVGKLNELNLRRLTELGASMPEDKQPTVSQANAIEELLANFKPGYTQPSYNEFMGQSSEGVTAAGTPA